MQVANSTFNTKIKTEINCLQMTTHSCLQQQLFLNKVYSTVPDLLKQTGIYRCSIYIKIFLDNPFKLFKSTLQLTTIRAMVLAQNEYKAATTELCS
jgi:hypothetical protein